MKFSRLLTLLLLCIFIGNCCYARNETQKEEWPAYLLAIFNGFGAGHHYLGDDFSLFFLGSQFAGCALITWGFVFLYFSPEIFSYEYAETTLTSSIYLISCGALVYLISRVWEIVDIFYAVKRAREAGKIAEFKPYIDIQPSKTGFGISYRF
jgi:hypothetical protein